MKYEAGAGTVRNMATLDELSALRRCALAVSVLYDIDVVPHADGVVLPRAGLVGWAAIARAVSTVDVNSERARERLGEWIWVREQVAGLPVAVLEASARVAGMPVDSDLHPGADWVREHVPGGALDLGLGLLGLDPQSPETVVPVAESVLRDSGLYGDGWWPAARERLDRMAELAAQRRQRDDAAPLRPMGDADVVTLLGGRALRARLAAEQPDGLATAVVPLRDRGWAPATRVDPAFGPAAAAIADEVNRGFSRPLLITAEELALVRDNGTAVRQVLRDSAELGSDGSPWRREVAPR
jgi:hypothetical protein